MDSSRYRERVAAAAYRHCQPTRLCGAAASIAARAWIKHITLPLQTPSLLKKARRLKVYGGCSIGIHGNRGIWGLEIGNTSNPGISVLGACG
jgi:hypothetical protein